MSMSATSARFIALCIFLFVASALITLSLRGGPQHRSSNSLSPWLPKLGKTSSQQPQHQPRVAFATFLAGNSNADANEDDDTDGYFVSARVMIYQLLHSPTASPNTTANKIPFLVLCTPNVGASKRARLTADGAIVIPVEILTQDWVHAADARWRDVLTKLRLWEQTSWNKICFIDADMLVTARLDGVFWDEGTIVQHTLLNPNQVQADEAKLPSSYMFATHADFWGYDHDYPPTTDSTYLNCGFFVFTPSAQMFAYYMSLLALPGRFDPGFPEQNLLNYAHRREGNMPWTPVWYGWNVNWPTRKDWEKGARSFHAKYWDADPSHDTVLKAIWREQRAEMEGFYRGWEGRGLVA